jgi:hypothetical protein
VNQPSENPIRFAGTAPGSSGPYRSANTFKRSSAAYWVKIGPRPGWLNWSSRRTVTCSVDAAFKAFLGASVDLIRNVHGVAPVAELDGDEIGFLVAKVAEIKRQR